MAFSSSYLPPYYTKFDRFLNQLGFTPLSHSPLPFLLCSRGPLMTLQKVFFFLCIWPVMDSFPISWYHRKVFISCGCQKQKKKTKSIFVDFKVWNFNFIYDFEEIRRQVYSFVSVSQLLWVVIYRGYKQMGLPGVWSII